MYAIQTVPMDTMKTEEIVLVVIQNVQNVMLHPPIVVPVQPMELINLFWMEVLVSINYLAQQEHMLKHQLMCAWLVIQAVFHVNRVKITVQCAQGTSPFYQMSAM